MDVETEAKKRAVHGAKSSSKAVRAVLKSKAGSVVRFHSASPVATPKTEELPSKTLQEINQAVAREVRQSGEEQAAVMVLNAGHSGGQTVVAAISGAQLENQLAKNLVVAVAKDNPDVDALCSTYKLRREELGRLTGFSLRALAEWAAGKLPSQPARRRLHEVRRLLDALTEIVELKAIHQWLHQPNEAFDKLTPLQVIEVGEIDRLWAMVHDLSSGQPS